MLLIPCPYCGARPELEFSYAGEAHISRAENQALLTDTELEDFLYLRSNTRGLHAERWRHTHGCGKFFNAIRDTVTDKFQTSYKVGEPRPATDILR